jgi:hypothetical protein
VLSDDERKFQLLFNALLVSCIAFLSAGAFITVIYYPPFWYLVGFVAATYRVAARELQGSSERLNGAANNQ